MSSNDHKDNRPKPGHRDPDNVQVPEASSTSMSRSSTKKEDGIIPEKKRKLRPTERKIAKNQLEVKTAKEAEKATKIMYKPGECMKHMSVDIHPDFLDFWFAADIAMELSATGAQVTPSPDLFDVNIVMWSRRSSQALQVMDGKVKLGTEKEPCNRCLRVMTGDEMLMLMREKELIEHMSTIVAMTGCSTTLVLIGIKNYIKKVVRKPPSVAYPELTEVQLDLALTDILVTTGCDTVMLNTANELAKLIVQFTKSIAEMPFKKAKHAIDEQVEFYMRGDNKKCVAVHKDGHGMSGVWQQMLAVLPQSSLELSRAVAANYPSPQMLYEILETPDGVSTIADIGVTRAAVPGVKARRVGPEFARKLKLLFTASDGNVLLD